MANQVNRLAVDVGEPALEVGHRGACHRRDQVETLATADLHEACNALRREKHESVTVAKRDSNRLQSWL
jgi:hypothetical protein